MKTTLFEFEDIINHFPHQILRINEESFNLKIENKWSKKEILGHLIDSSIVNYLRFIKAQFEDNPQIFYDQNQYCKSANYQKSNAKQLTELWTSINKQLFFLFEQNIDQNLLSNKCNDLTLEFLMKDYVEHLKHHQNQILK